MIKDIRKDFPSEYIFVSEDTYETLTLEEKALRVDTSNYPIGDARAYVIVRGGQSNAIFKTVQFIGDEHKVHMRKEFVFNKFIGGSSLEKIDFYYD